MTVDTRLLLTRAGNTGEDFLSVRAEWPDRVVIATEGGLTRTELSLSRDEAAQLQEALAGFLGN